MKFNVNIFDLSYDENFDKRIGSLTNIEIIKLIKLIEVRVISKQYIDEKVLFNLIGIIEDRLEFAQTFFEYRRLVICIQKIFWLIKKNIDYEYNSKEEKQYDSIIKSNPNIKNLLIKLLDLENEREEKLTTFFKMRNFYM